MATEALTGGISDAVGIALGAGIAMGLSALAAGWSQGSFGSALMGAIAERPEIEKNVLIWLVLPEILAILGFATAFLLIGKLSGVA
jgi:V/A-type H+-transporting ATPase subunit K